MEEEKEEKKYRHTVRSFIVRSGRMTKAQKFAMENYFSVYGINYEEKILDFVQVFGNTNPVIIEIGFGDGATTWQIAERNPDKNYIAIDVYPPGVGALLDTIEKKELKNLRVMNHDGVEVMESMISSGSVSGFHIFFPDPWHKKKHNKRRLLNSQFVSLLSDRLKSGGYIYAVTDWEEYAVQMQEVMRSEPLLASPFESYAPEGTELVPWRARTKFERKGLEKARLIRESYFEKR